MYNEQKKSFQFLRDLLDIIIRQSPYLAVPSIYVFYLSKMDSSLKNVVNAKALYSINYGQTFE